MPQIEVRIGFLSAAAESLSIIDPIDSDVRSGLEKAPLREVQTVGKVRTSRPLHQMSGQSPSNTISWAFRTRRRSSSMEGSSKAIARTWSTAVP